MKVDTELTRKLARLARLQLSDSETDAFTQQLGKIIDYVDLLQDASVEGVEPLFYPSLTGPGAAAGMLLRADSAREVSSDAEGKEPYRVPQVV